jgi:hypothetical protein
VTVGCPSLSRAECSSGPGRAQDQQVGARLKAGREKLPDMIASDLLLESPVSGAGPTVSSAPSTPGFLRWELCKVSTPLKIVNLWEPQEDPHPLH